MKGYKFKLEALLKMRKLKEEQCKMLIGRLQVEKSEHQKEIRRQNAGIDEAYSSQEIAAQKGATGLDLKFYPYFVEGKRTNIKILENKIADLDHKINQGYEVLKKLRANVKVLEEMKTKDKESYKKQLNKKREETLEEQVLIWNHSRNKAI